MLHGSSWSAWLGSQRVCSEWMFTVLPCCHPKDSLTPGKTWALFSEYRCVGLVVCQHPLREILSSWHWWKDTLFWDKNPVCDGCSLKARVPDLGNLLPHISSSSMQEPCYGLVPKYSEDSASYAEWISSNFVWEAHLPCCSRSAFVTVSCNRAQHPCWPVTYLFVTLSSGVGVGGAELALGILHLPSLQKWNSCFMRFKLQPWEL